MVFPLDFYATSLTDGDLFNSFICGIFIVSKFKDTFKDVASHQVTVSTDTVQTIQHSQQALVTQLRLELMFRQISHLLLSSCGAKL